MCAYILWRLYLFIRFFVVKPGHALLSAYPMWHIIPIWRYSMAVLGMPRPVTACLTCHCVGWCDAMLNQPICSRPSWHKGELIGGRHVEKGIGPGVWRGMASKNLLNYCPQNGPEHKQGFDGVCVVCSFSVETR